VLGQVILNSSAPSAAALLSSRKQESTIGPQDKFNENVSFHKPGDANDDEYRFQNNA